MSRSPAPPAPPVQPGASITLIDVAKAAGVSPITVSRALNEPHLVKPATLAKVQEAVKRTGYVKNMLAGGLASSRSKLVALVLPTISTQTFADMVQGATDRLTAVIFAANHVGLALNDAYNQLSEQQQAKLKAFDH